MPDYSEFHTQITDLFAWPDTDEQWRALELPQPNPRRSIHSSESGRVLGLHSARASAVQFGNLC